MKLKITITGSKVQGVGYRPYLAGLAMRLALRGFEVYNDDNMVVVLLESDEQRVKKFLEIASKEKPLLAMVDKVVSEDYTGDVMPLWQFASINTATQMNKAIPILLAVEKNTDTIPQIAKNTDTIPQIHEEIKGLRDDIQLGLAIQFRQVQADIRAIKDRLGMP
jgi:hydrogenase maturation factor HypF (carbamoyltransferase family)